jgi:hypothetical protein
MKCPQSAHGDIIEEGKYMKIEKLLLAFRKEQADGPDV